MDTNAIQVRMFGDFSLAWQDEVISAGSSRSKVWLLLAYLLYHRDRLVPRDELFRLMDSTGRSDDPGNVLRIYRSRLRKLLEPISDAVGCELIIGERGAYGWNPNVPVSLDVQEFESVCENAERADAEMLRGALTLYRGDFLAALSMEAWVGPLSAYYQNLFIDSATRALPLLQEAGDTQEAVTLGRAAIEVSPYHEPLYQALMRVMIASGDNDGAARVYEKLRKLLLDDLGVLPSDETREIYQQLSQVSGEGRLGLDTIRTRLQETIAPTGAMICDFESFKLFYRAEARSADRRGDAIHIGLLSLESKNGDRLSPRSTETAMGQLRRKIQESLRVGDIAASCSATQYVVMLLQANYENSEMVLKRVIRAFGKAYPQSPAQIRLSIIPLEPLFSVEPAQ